MNPRSNLNVVLIFAFTMIVVIAACNSNNPTAKSSDSEGDSSQRLSSSEHPASPSSSSSSAVEGLSANVLIANESNRHEGTTKALRDVRERGDMEASKRILRVRLSEVARVIDAVNTGSYSIEDKQKILVFLEREKDWADISVAFFVAEVGAPTIDLIPRVGPAAKPPF